MMGHKICFYREIWLIPGDDDLSSSSESGEKAKPAKTKV